MERNSSVQGLILSARTFGESNRLITVLSPERGIFNAVQYGGKKSRLRSMVQIFHSGKMWIYEDAVKEQIKITDFDVTSYRPSLRESLLKNWAASVAMEIILKTNCADENEKSWILANGFLDGLNFVKEDETKIALLRFIWRYLNLLGLQADTTKCCICHSPLTTIGIYSKFESSFVCSDCSDASSGEQSLFALSGESLRFLEAVKNKSSKESRAIKLSENANFELQKALFILIENAAGTKLNTLKIKL